MNDHIPADFSNDESERALGEMSLAQKIDFLRDPDSYPEPTKNVTVVKTHMSCVFITDEYVYKLKKPFRNDHLELETPEARHKNCLAEVDLNRRLAEDVYLGVVPLVVDEWGELMLEQEEGAIDWLVKMKRLSSDKMLDQWIKTGQKISRNKLKPAADLLVRFYNTVERASLSVRAYKRKLNTAINNCRDELLDPVFDLPKLAVKAIYQKQITFIKKHRLLLKNRIKENRVIEGHGDLKPEHICLSPPVIIDCLEFDKDLRTIDIIDDLAFLAVECDRLGAPWVGRYFMDYYMNSANDHPPEIFIAFYKSYNAYIRALLTIRHIKEAPYKDDPKWRKKTLGYLELAGKYML